MSLTTKSNKPLFPIGIGTWNIGSRINSENLGSTYRGVEPVHGHEDQEIEAIRYSISKGQNHIDCAELYGGFYTDEIVGRALAGADRSNLYIADKLWKTSVGRGLVRPTVEKMLKKLGTDYIDLLYIHAPWEEVPWREAIPQIGELIDEGVVRQFGVSNFSVDHMQEALALSKHPIAANQVKCNVLYKDDADQTFRNFCKGHDIKIVAYQPVKRQEVLANEAVKIIAETLNATPAQVALAWLIQMDMLPIPKATTKSHIDENVGAVNLKLTDAEVQALSRIS
jgi:diketogulonate reductase-like aldo/keto reductase